MYRYPKHITKLMMFFQKLPGVGRKTAERYTFHVLNWQDNTKNEFTKLISDINNQLSTCINCGCLIDSDAIKCKYCNPEIKNASIFCIVAFQKDVFYIEAAQAYRGVYHVLGTLMSSNPLNNRLTEAVEKLTNRVLKEKPDEIILAFDSTLEGDSTALFIKKTLEKNGFKVSRPASGLPIGCSLESIDGGTLAKAITDRKSY